MTATTRQRMRAARLFTLLAVLVGLVLMHGGLGAAGGDCHDVTLMARGAVAMSSPATHGSSRASAAPHAASDGGGGLCASVPARDAGAQLPAPSMPLLGVLLLLLAARQNWPLGMTSSRRRGPPVAGRVLLDQVCTARI